MLGVSLDLSLSFSHGRKMKKAWMNGRVRTEASLGDRLRTEMMRQHHCLTMCDRVMELEAWGVQQGGLVMDSTGWLSCGCDGACGGGSCDRFDFGKMLYYKMTICVAIYFFIEYEFKKNFKGFMWISLI
ncbi:uncharacterized protein LOC133803429 isoform X3 [Humulus lupulus]|uniref:uncharacterized protein LOC133803429 isoform X3 n=1 Tax=Humulus lupulus TaxID=3486 RepID=UPI002B418596|nr:uncharacterized protein LOC133803429 isoform X3 [Humulus lupulus]